MQVPRVLNNLERASTGVSGLDDILGGGLKPSRLYLLEGSPGTGKTTFALQFLMAGVAKQEKTLYVTLSETTEELADVVDSHGWSLNGVDIFELVNEVGLSSNEEQSILHPSEVELGETIRNVTQEVERLNPSRVVFDSLSELRLLAQDPLRYRRQVLALKHFFSSRRCTVLLLDDKTSDAHDLQLHSIAHGVISLSQTTQEFGNERRTLRVAKMRGMDFQAGVHDFNLKTGSVEVFPRLVASRHSVRGAALAQSTGLTTLDAMLGGGLTPGTNLLLLGPSGIGKTTTSAICMRSALLRGERCCYYLFDEGLPVFLARTKALDIDCTPYIESGQLTVSQIDPAEMSPGEFAFRVVTKVQEGGAKFVVIDSLNAYMQAMPGQNFLLLHMHELLTFLNQQGVITVLIVGQHGLVGDTRSEIDLSYLSDAILLYRFFEANGQVHSAISALKSRTGENERSIREFRISRAKGVEVGAALHDFEGVLSGLPTYRGGTPMLGTSDT